jgi:catechol 2,3-dioxygenase-like lactoylglutathione lyase family enzyme
MELIAGEGYLRVADIERSLHFYRDGLGFLVTDQALEDGRPFWVRLKRDLFSVMISDRPSRFVEDTAPEEDHEHREDGHHTFPGVGATHAGELNLVTFLYVADADAAYQELLDRGVEPLDAPADKFYGVREFLVRDPDGYFYAVAQPVKR